MSSYACAWRKSVGMDRSVDYAESGRPPNRAKVDTDAGATGAPTLHRSQFPISAFSSQLTVVVIQE